ncbi:unnamed protein product [Closterium sp. NIES-54]
MDAGGWADPTGSADGEALDVLSHELQVAEMPREIHGEAGENQVGNQPEDLHGEHGGDLDAADAFLRKDTTGQALFDCDVMISSPATSSGPSSDSLLATHAANPAAIGGDSAQKTRTPRVGVELASADNATAEQQQCRSQGGGVGVAVGGSVAGADADASVTVAFLDAGTIANGDATADQQPGIPGVGVVVGGDANADAHAIYNVDAGAKGGATAGQQLRNQGAGAGAAAGDSGGADADDAGDADAYAKGETSAEQQSGSQGVGVVLAGSVAGADADASVTVAFLGAGYGGTGLTYTGVLQQIQGCASASSDGAMPASTTNIQRDSVLCNIVSLGGEYGGFDDATAEQQHGSRGAGAGAAVAGGDTGTGDGGTGLTITGQPQQRKRHKGQACATASNDTADRPASTTNMRRDSEQSNIVSHGGESGGFGGSSITAACDGGSGMLVASGTGDGDRASSHLSGTPRASSKAALNESETPVFPDLTNSVNGNLVASANSHNLQREATRSICATRSGGGIIPAYGGSGCINGSSFDPLSIRPTFRRPLLPLDSTKNSSHNHLAEVSYTLSSNLQHNVSTALTPQQQTLLFAGSASIPAVQSASAAVQPGNLEPLARRLRELRKNGNKMAELHGPSASNRTPTTPNHPSTSASPSTTAAESAASGSDASASHTPTAAVTGLSGATYRWHNNGNKIIGRNGPDPYYRKYYCCSESNCPAACTFDYFDEQTWRITDAGTHNHDPPAGRGERGRSQGL